MTDLLKGKRVVVMGFARQGQALARWLPLIEARAVVTDMRQEAAFGDSLAPYRAQGVTFVLGEHPLSLLDGADLLCISGGVPLDAPLVVEAFRRGVPVSNDAQLFLERCPAPVIGITGSAGKTTTTTLIGRMCAAGGQTTFVGGNIGEVLLDVLPRLQPSDTVVMELSSFQLELMTVSPHIGVILNVTPNHLDRHGTMEVYTAAKTRLIQFQRPEDVAVLGYDDAVAASLRDATGGRVIGFSTRRPVEDGAYLDGERLMVTGLSSPDGRPRPVMTRDEILLRGDHNVLNVLAACATAGAAGIPPEVMRRVVADFRGVAHRMEIVRQHNGVTWINDSIATAPERVLAAVRSYREPLVMLLGGRDKKLPWEPLAAQVVRKARAVVAFGEFGPAIVDILGQTLRDAPEAALHPDAIHCVRTLDEAVPLAAGLAQPGDVVLLSPGGTSYDAYRDFEERGAHYQALVNGLDR